MTDIDYTYIPADVELRRARNKAQSTEAVLAAFCAPLDITTITVRCNTLTLIMAFADLVLLTMAGAARAYHAYGSTGASMRDAAVERLLAVPQIGSIDTRLSTLREAYDAATYLPRSTVVDHGVNALQYITGKGGLYLVDRAAAAAAAGQCVLAAGPAARAVALEVLWNLR